MNYEELKNKLDSIDLQNPYSLSKFDKSSFLKDILNDLSTFHTVNCEGYRNFNSVFATKHSYHDLESIPALPVRAFKMHDLYSIDSNSILKTLTSSGTSGQSVSKIYLDNFTARRQTKVLTSITKDFIGKSRLPMIIMDSSELLKDRSQLNARAAGILGYSVFGRDHFYCLDNKLEILEKELRNYLDKYSDQPLLIFGFTYIIWQTLMESIKKDINFNFGNKAILIHGGGWKKLADQNISNDQFKKDLKKKFGINNTFNYYGMVEQVGSIFMECEKGYLHCPDFADIIVRDPNNLEVLDNGREGVVQVLSILPLSYPGHSLLTEDLGTIHGEDDCECGRKGKFFTISGRMPMAELRGCSDTRVA
jgi:hypothetical protein